MFHHCIHKNIQNINRYRLLIACQFNNINSTEKKLSTENDVILYMMCDVAAKSVCIKIIHESAFRSLLDR